MGQCKAALGVVLASLLVSAVTAEGRADESLVDETAPIDLTLADLEQLTGGAWEPQRPLFERSTFQRHSFIQNSISMPIANAFAVCFMCSGDAMAVAMAGAIGSGRADATSLASGRGEAFTSSFAGGQPFIFVFPDSFTPSDFEALR